MSDSSSSGVLKYTPSIAGNAAFGVLYETIAILLLVNLLKRRDWWGLCLPIGAFCQGLGFFLRIALARSAFSLSLYVPEEFFTVLSPACYLAFNYIWFGRLCQRYEELLEGRQDTKARKHITFLSPRKFGLVFIVSDVTTFLIQAGGGGMQVSEGLQNAGSIIFLFGIVAQFASYLFFLTLSIPVVRSMNSREASSQQSAEVKTALKQVFAILYFSSAWIIVRSIYRTIELAQGYGGALSSKEGELRLTSYSLRAINKNPSFLAYFFGLDSAPLVVAIGTYVFVWPTSLLELKEHSTTPRYPVPWEAGSYVNQVRLSLSGFSARDLEYCTTSEEKQTSER